MVARVSKHDFRYPIRRTVSVTKRGLGFVGGASATSESAGPALVSSATWRLFRPRAA